jgi:nucleoside-diphosphate-sugar epimerase
VRVLVTGAAGFIGSHLTERLLAEGHTVLGIDAFTEYYDRTLKERNISGVIGNQSFDLVEGDLASIDLAPLVADRDLVFHLAAQPGVRSSWGDDFHIYLERNLWATQRLLEAVRGLPLRKLVFASSSSVYGDSERYPTFETDLPQPISPYGVTKLASEQLCLAYARTAGIPVAAMRYFTVYGPRQRPDMAFSRFISSLLRNQEISIYGDGKQTRDFTYVSDAVEATYQAALAPSTNQVFNVGGGSRVSLLDVLSMLGEVTQEKPRIRLTEAQAGDVRDTAADTQRARQLLGYQPRVSLRAGLLSQVDFEREFSVPAIPGGS